MDKLQALTNLLQDRNPQAINELVNVVMDSVRNHLDYEEEDEDGIISIYQNGNIMLAESPANIDDALYGAIHMTLTNHLFES